MRNALLNLYAFNRAITAYDPCDADVPVFVPEASCLDERSRIIGAMAVRTSVDLESLDDTAAIDAAIAADTVRIAKGLAGNWAPGTSNKKPGMGYNREKHSSWTFAIPLKHYSVDANLGFWNAINNSQGWSLLLVFEDLSIWGALDTDKKAIPMDIVMSPASDDELGGTRRFEGTAGWTARDLPYTLTAPVIAGFTAAELSTRFKG